MVNFAVAPAVPALRIALIALVEFHSFTKPKLLAPEWKPISVRFAKESLEFAGVEAQFLFGSKVITIEPSAFLQPVVAWAEAKVAAEAKANNK